MGPDRPRGNTELIGTGGSDDPGLPVPQFHHRIPQGSRYRNSFGYIPGKYPTSFRPGDKYLTGGTGTGIDGQGSQNRYPESQAYCPVIKNPQSKKSFHNY
jgi:hypothetical protein